MESKPCACRFVEEAAADPGSPLIFDAAMNEYWIRHSTPRGEGFYVVYYCPCCGGAVPKSKRESFFADVTREEERRLFELTRGLQTVADAVERLGAPDEDYPTGYKTKKPETDGAPAECRAYRLLRYTCLSETVDVELVDLGPERGLWTALYGKFLGRRRE